jgi:hypothetical protein
MPLVRLDQYRLEYSVQAYSYFFCCKPVSTEFASRMHNSDYTAEFTADLLSSGGQFIALEESPASGRKALVMLSG